MQLKSRKWNAIGHNDSMLRFHNGGNLTLGIGIPMDFDELRKPKLELYQLQCSCYVSIFQAHYNCDKCFHPITLLVRYTIVDVSSLLSCDIN